MRIFLSFNSKEIALAEAIQAGLAKLEPAAAIFFSPVSLGSGFWLPKLAEEIAAADAFLLLIGPQGIGPWQEVEYFTALDRHVSDKTFALVPVMAAGAQAPGLSFLRSLNWVDAPVADDATLRRVLGVLKGEAQTRATPLWKLVNPYRGLEAMTEANADYFYERAAETAAVLNALSRSPDRLPVLIGASGVGKSSVAQAGVLAALKSMRWPGAEASAWPTGLRNSRGWVALIVRPGETPLEALSAAFVGLWGLDGKDPDHAALPRKWGRGLLAGDNKLTDLIGATQEELKKRQGEAPERVLVYLNQGEELYTRAARQEAQRFSDVLAEGLDDRRFLAFASMRADYFDRLQADEPLFKRHEHINVPPLDRGQLHTVVTAPARALGVSFEDDGGAERITAAAAAEPGALPLLSYLLTDMWNAMVARGRPVLVLPAHAIDVGGVLASRAESFLNENPDQENALRHLLTLKLALIPPEGEPVRRQTHRGECTEAEWSLAGRLADYPYRLVVMSERGADGRIVAEAAHEAFLRAWPRLVHWLREERDFLVFKGEAERAERRWRDMGKPDRALLTGLDLARAEEWLPARAEDLPEDVIAYIRRSIAFDRAAKERQLRFQRRVAIGAFAAALLMAVIGGFAWMQWDGADQARKRADAELALAQTNQSRFLAAQASERRAEGDAGTAILLALEGLSVGAAGTMRPEAQLQLDGASRELRERLVISAGQPMNGVAYSPDGKRIATASSDRTVRVWDAGSGQAIGAPLAGHEDSVASVAFSPDGKRIVTASFDGTARLWDAETGRQTGALVADSSEGLRSAAFSPDGSRIVTAGFDNMARLWDAETGKPIGAPLAGHEGWVTSAEFSPDGQRIVTASADATVRLWDAKSGEPVGQPLKGHAAAVWSAAFSPDGKRIVTASADKTARLWDVEGGREIGAPLIGHTAAVGSAAFSPDGKRIVTSSEDKTARIWDAATGRPLGAPFAGHLAAVWRATFSPDGMHIATASGDSTARIWDAVTGRPLGVPLGDHKESVMSAAFSPDGRRIVTASADRTARVWDAATGAMIALLSGHKSLVAAAAFSPDGKRVVTGSFDRTAQQWDAATGEPIGKPLVGHTDAVAGVAFSPDGKRIVTGSFDHTARLWDAETGDPIGAPLAGHTFHVRSVAFSPDGKRILTASYDKTARLWDAETGKPVGVPLAGHTHFVYAAAFSPDGKRIVTASFDGTARLWDAETGKPIGAPLKGHTGQVTSAAFSADGKRIVSASWDETIRVWDADSGKEIAELADDSRVNSAAFSPDGGRILTADDRTARLWDVFAGAGDLVAHAQAVVPRCLTPEERATLSLPAEPPAWCIERNKWPYQTTAWKEWLGATRAGGHPALPVTR